MDRTPAYWAGRPGADCRCTPLGHNEHKPMTTEGARLLRLHVYTTNGCQPSTATMSPVDPPTHIPRTR
jgi:hypothetical protein